MTDLGPYGVVFSGGGALGAWEVGCLHSLLRRHETKYPLVVAGASAGALNAAGLALGMTVGELHAAWKSLSPAAVFSPNPRGRTWRAVLTSVAFRAAMKGSVLGAASAVVAGLKSVFDATPLDETLDRLLRPRWDNLPSFKGTIAIAVTNLSTNSKKYYYYPQNVVSPSQNWHPITSFEVLKEALLASTAIPIVFEPRNDEVDGGVLHNQPLAAADYLLPPGHPIYVLVPQTDRLPTALDLAVLPGRLLQAWMSQGFKYELSRLAVRNIAAKALSEPLRPVCLIRSAFDLEERGSGLLKFGSAVDAIVPVR